MTADAAPSVPDAVAAHERRRVAGRYGRPVVRRRKVSSATASPATRARYAKRRARRVALADNDLTPAEWESLLAAWGGCAYCGAEAPALQRDCVLAISRGGRYTLENVVPACASCNASKHNDEVTGWLRRKKLDERAFLVRHATILRDLRPADPLDPA
ncbi:HNH endonuclease [Cellulomonas hominis]|nr:HNH endonuclease [Cellulomonas hominis]